MSSLSFFVKFNSTWLFPQAANCIMDLVKTYKRTTLALYLNRIRRAGVYEGMSELDNNRVLIVNTLNITLGVLLITIGGYFCFVTKQLTIIIPATIEFSIVIASMLGNYFRKYDQAAFLTYLGQCCAVGYFGLLLRNIIELQVMIVWLISITFLIFKARSTRIKAFCVALLTTCLLESSNYIPMHLQPVVLDANIQRILHTLAFSGVIVLIMMVSRPYVLSRDLNPELKRANDFKQMFVRQISHELRTPLNAIYAISQSLKRELIIYDGSPAMKEMVENLMHSSQTMKGIINNVLDMAQIESGKMDILRRVDFDLTNLVKHEIAITRRLAQRRNLKIQFAEEDIPQAIMDDPLWITQILTNLLGNAIKYSFANTVIRVSLTRNNETYLLCVSNEAPTIPAEKQETLFDPFVSDRTGNIEGAGLGLYVVKNKVEQLGGSIRLDSENNITTVTVQLPLIEGDVEHIKPEYEDGDKDLSEIYIAIADDDKMNAIYVSKFLSDMGCTVSLYENGEQLVQHMQRPLPDVVILDGQMPVMDGLTTLRYLKSHTETKDIPVVVVTGDTFANSQAFVHAGASACIHKPFEFEVLRRTIREQLESDHAELQE